MLEFRGLCRFSYPTLDGQGFRCPLIYDPARLRRRLDLFENICLPSIRSQTDKDFELIVMVGENMPLLAELTDIVAGTRQIKIVTLPEGLPHIETCSAVLTGLRTKTTGYVGEFCMDDDDAVACDFIAEARDMFASVQPIVAKGKPVELDFCRGIAAKLTGNDLALKHVIAPHWTPAQLIFQKASARRSLFNYHHYRFWRRHDCLSVARTEPMFIRTFHGENDSATDWDPMRHEPLTGNPADMLRTRFGITAFHAAMAEDRAPLMA